MSWHPSMISLSNLSERESPMITMILHVSNYSLDTDTGSPQLNLQTTDTYWAANSGDKSCFHQQHINYTCSDTAQSSDSSLSYLHQLQTYIVLTIRMTSGNRNHLNLQFESWIIILPQPCLVSKVSHLDIIMIQCRVSPTTLELMFLQAPTPGQYLTPFQSSPASSSSYSSIFSYDQLKVALWKRDMCNRYLIHFSPLLGKVPSSKCYN